MSRVLLDTDVVSFIFRGDDIAALYSRLVEDRMLFISFQTVAETTLWALIYRWGTEKRRRFDRFLQKFGVYDHNPDLSVHWAQVKHEARLAGRPIEAADAWIAATALALKCPLVTHNVKDYVGVKSVQLLSVPPLR